MEIRWKTISLKFFSKWPGYIKAIGYSVRYFLCYRNAERSINISPSGMDIVTIVFKSEIALLRLQARSLDRFLDPTFEGSIIVIVNDLDQRTTIDHLTGSCCRTMVDGKTGSGSCRSSNSGMA